MLRGVLSIIAGLVLGVALAYGLGRIGPPGNPDIQRAQDLLAQEGYWRAAPSRRWTPEHLAALNAYEADWGLPLTTEIGWTEPLSADLMARLARTHPATRPQWVRSAGGCRVWNAHPLPRERVAWDGVCDTGVASGKGTLVWTSFYDGDWNEERFAGALRRGKTDGSGVFVTAVGDRYEGRFKDNRFHGQGTYYEAGGGVFQGLFSEGYPNGYGKLVDWNGQVFEGNWKRGCLTTWSAEANFLRSGEDCGIKRGWSLKELFDK